MDDEFTLLRKDNAQAVLDGKDEQRRHRFELLQQLGEKYITTGRDRLLLGQINFMVDRTLASLTSSRPEGRVVFVIGESGAGKTWAIEQTITKVPGLQEQLLCVTAPRPCDLTQLGRAILAKLGIVPKRELKEHLVWELVREHLERNRIRFVWIDELQHLFKNLNEETLGRVSDTIKNLVQRREWPIGFIISGLPVMSLLAEDRQIERRSRSLSFQRLSFPNHVRHMRRGVMAIIEKHAAMTADPAIATDEFIHRLCHAAEGAFGVVLSLAKDAVTEAVSREDFNGIVRVADFAYAYEMERNCEPSQNIFTVDNWYEIVPGNSRLRDDGSVQAMADKKPGRARRA